MPSLRRGVGGIYRGPITPQQVSVGNLVIWQEDDLTPLYTDNGFTTPAVNEGDAIGSLRGMLGTDDATQATAGNKPQLHVASSPWAPKRAINCTDAVRWLTTTLAAGTLPKSWFAVVYCTSQVASNMLFGAETANQAVEFVSSNTLGQLRSFVDATGSTVSTGTVSLNTKTLIGGTLAANGAFTYWKGTTAANFAQDATTGTNADTSPIADSRRIFNNGAGTAGLVGYAPLRLEYNAVLTAAEFATLANYAYIKGWIG